MPVREAPSYSSTRVQRASRLNALEAVRLHQRLNLLEKARLHQARLTNQDIRLTSMALEYILNCSGHSLEGRGPEGQPCGVEVPGQQDEPFYLYGERVVSRKVRRMARPQSAMERSSCRQPGSQDADSLASGEDSVSGGRSRLPPRPQSSPAKGRSWGSWSANRRGEEEEDDKGESEAPGHDPEVWPPSRGSNTFTSGASRPSTPGSAGPARGGSSTGRATPHRAWEDDTDEITRRLLKARQLQLQQERLKERENDRRRSRRYMQDLSRAKSASSRSFAGYGSSRRPSAAESAASPAPRVPSPPTPVIEDKLPVSPAVKHGQRNQGGAGKRAGLTEIMAHTRSTMSANAWRSHLASTQLAPRSAESQRQFVLQTKRDAERQRQQEVLQRVESFMEQIAGDGHIHPS